MHIKTFRVKNFRRLKDARVDLEQDKSIFVGANNSGKTSATHLFQLFLNKQSRGSFKIYDFTADCWSEFNSFDYENGNPDTDLPQITFDVWFSVDEDNLHRALDLLPSLDWDGRLVGLRMKYAPRDGAQLIANYTEARRKAGPAGDDETGSYKPWPQTMVDYLTKRLQQEYEIKYAKLDSKQCDNDLNPLPNYKPQYFGTHLTGAAKIVDAIVRVDFLNAQRHLSDLDSHGRSEELSKRLSRFYDRNLEKLENDLDALGVIAQSEERLNEHFAQVFKPTLDRLGQVGYPGVANPRLLVKASFNAYNILTSSASVHYELAGGDFPEPATIGITLPDQYNGLGFKNLIYMVVEILDFNQAWRESPEERPPVHLLIIEEPEVHLHAQLQQVFIKKIIEILPDPEEAFTTQLIVTTHSPHIIYESDFTPIRYFCRLGSPNGLQLSDVRNLSLFYDNEAGPTREFLQQYIKLTHCDLFFADAAVLVEGNVERLLLPLIIERNVPNLRSCHLTILEVGGAFAHLFENLVAFLSLPTLIITDLDSTDPTSSTDDEDEVTDGPASRGRACPVSTAGAVTSNQTLRSWLPKMESIQALLAADEGTKVLGAADGSSGAVRVAYQTVETVSWQGESEERAARTLEEAFALQNLAWTQGNEGSQLGLRIKDATNLNIDDLHDRLFKRVKSFDKTKFALAVIAAKDAQWQSPKYIVEGLEWLLTKVAPPAASLNSKSEADPSELQDSK
ncbi:MULTISPECIES: ATP-dependent endonuclease [Mycobacterium]|uniref:ATP-dependent endonuclease n=1 Tax=Mycobacterium TaxID=1763 RepID=UPI0009E823AF|nr:MULTISPECIES: ATP-dependent endonuclease [Mycobacterium]MDP7732145.1 ATP-dependent endonuclease [Mycobacterium sp. TY813]